jgi:hypothetical protein
MNLKPSGCLSFSTSYALSVITQPKNSLSPLPGESDPESGRRCFRIEEARG